MNSLPHLLDEDRPEYERILDEVLRSAPTRPELTAVDKRLNPEQLRTMALNATTLITAAAAPEYQHYVKVREELRHPPSPTPSPVREPGSAKRDTDAKGLATPLGEVAEDGGAVFGAAILSSLLAATATAIFLLAGYILKLLNPELALAKTMLTAGWVFGATTAAAVLIATVGLLFTALHNGPSPDTGANRVSGGEVARAREAWHQALLERGLLPFLQEAPTFQAALAHAGTAAPHSPAAPTPTGRMPHLGYNRPDFTSPDFSSPAFEEPERRPE
ncbi:hypothetical protein [Streptomyces sp. NPDC058295]|uniref:hypothetical protein n=1 Tax=Streptomyces sp. NPDC058295 TaxID=3346431 RepID=UPI0036ED7341